MKFKEALKKVREESPERNFNQSLELIVNLQAVDVGNFSLNDTVNLPAGRGKDYTICVVGRGDFTLKGKKCADKVLDQDELGEYDSKKKVSAFSKDVDFFVVEAPVMAEFAKAFGAVLGPRGKMPLPHHIVPPGGEPCPMVKKLREVVRVRAKNTAVVQVPVGTQKMTDDQLLENVKVVYDFIKGKLPHGQENVKEALLKFTMGPVVTING
jgi:large subunit ribosomal protein L1